MRLIDADELKRLFTKSVKLVTNMTNVFSEATIRIVNIVAQGLIKDIDEQPTAEAEPVRHGHWELVHPLQDDDEGAYMCSECRTGDYGVERYSFCPFCGAKMGEAQS